MSKSSRALTEKQEAFCVAYSESGHQGAASVRAAGYNTVYTRQLASQLLSTESVKARIEVLDAQKPNRIIPGEYTKEDLAREMARIAFSDPQAKSSDKIAALKALGSDVGMFGGEVREDTGTRAALAAALEAMARMPEHELEEFIDTFKARTTEAIVEATLPEVPDEKTGGCSISKAGPAETTVEASPAASPAGSHGPTDEGAEDLDL